MDEHDDLLRRLHDLGTRPIDPARQARDLRAMAAARSSRPLLRAGSKLRLAGAFLAGLLIGSTGLAAADALPDPAQHVAHTVLGRVGVDVPDPERYHGPECGAEVKRNHGGYVRDDPSLAQSDCGKPVRSRGGAGGEGDQAPGAATQAGPCQGKPSWAGDKSMTPAEKAAAQAERTAQCGSDDDAAEPEGIAPEGVDAPTTTVLAPTTTEAPTTETSSQAPATTAAETTTSGGG